VCNGMNIGVLLEILGHNSIKVTLDSYGAIINELMTRNVKELKEKLSPKKDKIIISEFKESNSAQRDLLNELKESSSN
jgi:superfamily I DNA/RNA helicase